MAALITGKQVASIVRIFTDGKLTSARAQMLIDSGLITDLRDADLEVVSRTEFRVFLGLPPVDTSGLQTFKVLKLNDGREIELVIVSNTELGFRHGATLNETCSRAQGIGLDSFTARMLDQGGHLALKMQYKDQPVGEELFLGKPRLQSGGSLHIFCLTRHKDGQQYFKGCFYKSDEKLSPDSRWIFLRRVSA